MICLSAISPRPKSQTVQVVIAANLAGGLTLLEAYSKIPPFDRWSVFISGPDNA